MKKNMKDAIHADVQKQARRNKTDTSWLERNKVFNHALRMPEKEQCIVLALFAELEAGRNINKITQKILDVEILLANLLSRKGKPLAVALDGQKWKISRYTRTSPYIVELVNAMKEKGFIEMKKGYHTEKDSRITRIWATEKLMELFPILPNCVISKPPELVELRDDKGKLIEYKDTEETRRIRAILERVNAVNAKADILYGKYSINAYLVAIFKQKFTLYGRLHTRGYQHYQGFSEDERAEITINGEPVVELDFSGLHPRLLYVKEGIQFDDDPYTVVHENPQARPFLKSVLLFMLNAKDDLQAERTANYWLFQNTEERIQLEEIGITRARPIIEAFKQAHKPIGHYFCSGKTTGLRIMNLVEKTTQN